MKSLSFRKDLIGVQEELLRFAYKLTANREEANDLLQETSLKALDNYGAQNETYIEGWEKKTSNLLIYKRLCNV